MKKKSSSKQPPSKQTHWEMQYGVNEPSENMKLTGGADFAPKRGSERKTTYKKVNKLDH